MKLYWAALLLAGALGFLLLLLADYEQKASVERLTNYKSKPEFRLELEPGLMPVKEHSLHVRGERY